MRIPHVHFPATIIGRPRFCPKGRPFPRVVLSSPKEENPRVSTGATFSKLLNPPFLEVCNVPSIKVHNCHISFLILGASCFSSAPLKSITENLLTFSFTIFLLTILEVEKPHTRSLSQPQVQGKSHILLITLTPPFTSVVNERDFSYTTVRAALFSLNTFSPLFSSGTVPNHILFFSSGVFLFWVPGEPRPT